MLSYFLTASRFLQREWGQFWKEVKLEYCAAIFSGASCYMAHTYRNPSTDLSQGGPNGENTAWRHSSLQMPSCLGFPSHHFPPFFSFLNGWTKRGPVNIETATHTAVLSSTHSRTCHRSLSSKSRSELCYTVCAIAPFEILGSFFALEITVWVLEENNMTRFWNQKWSEKSLNLSGDKGWNWAPCRCLAVMPP